MLTYILLALAVAALALIILVAMQPRDFRISRSAAIAASPDKIFPHIENLRLMQEWSPWEKMDPNMDREYEGPAAGPGAVYRWNGNKNIGKGSLTVVESRPDTHVKMQLNFLRPFKCTNEVEYELQQEGSQTLVTWAMSGQNNFMGKAMALCMNMDKMCGSQFEQGLQSLKQIVEGRKVDSATGELGSMSVSPQPAI